MAAGRRNNNNNNNYNNNNNLDLAIGFHFMFFGWTHTHTHTHTPRLVFSDTRCLLRVLSLPLFYQLFLPCFSHSRALLTTPRSAQPQVILTKPRVKGCHNGGKRDRGPRVPEAVPGENRILLDWTCCAHFQSKSVHHKYRDTKRMGLHFRVKLSKVQVKSLLCTSAGESAVTVCGTSDNILHLDEPLH